MKSRNKKFCSEILKIVLWSGQDPQLLQQYFEASVLDQCKREILNIKNGKQTN